MQFPFMSPGVPNYITYAMVGAVIGHEVSHAFDDQGLSNNLLHVSAHGCQTITSILSLVNSIIM